jgi:methylase of polypeptide subunit release factors
MMDSLRYQPDVIVFNPPYIPSDSEEEEKERVKYELKMKELK